MNKNLINKAVDCLSIVDIRLRTTSIDVNDDYSPYLKTGEEQDEQLEVQFINSIESHRTGEVEAKDKDKEQKIVEYFYNAAFRIREKDADTQEKNNLIPLVEVKATFMAVYMISAESSPNEETLIEFGKHNVGFNIWPYWREYASSSATRLGLPNIIVPLYRMPKDAKK